MRVCLGAFAVGVIAAHAYPAPIPLAIILGSGAIAATFVRQLCPVAVFALGVAWGSLAAGDALRGQRVQCTRPIPLSLVVDGLPAKTGVMQRFEGIVLASTQCGLARGDRVRLTWMSAQESAQPARARQLRPGQRWRVTARVNGPRAYVNPYGFDYERWLLRRGVVATGYVVDGAIAMDTTHLVDDFRLRLRERIDAMSFEHGGLILALATGDTALVPPATWQRFRDTATVHLLVISGLHIGMFAALGLGVGNLICRLLPVTRRLSARAMSAGFAIAAVLAYATAAGWSLPVIRAVIMACVGVAAATAGRRLSASVGFTFALAIVLALDPLAVLDTGFWLSFTAVGILIAFFAPRAAVGPRLSALIRTQLVIWVGFAPALGILVGQVHLLSPLTNLALIPLVAMAAAPLSVIGAFGLSLAPSLAEPVLTLADAALGAVMWILARVGEVDPVPMGPSSHTLIAAAALSGGFLLPWSRAARCFLGACVFACLLSAGHSDPGTFEVTVMDVGQGSSVLVRTRRHALVYDTGARYPSGFDVGEAIVVPTVVRLHGAPITELVLSHSDIDHVGGAQAVMKHMAVRGVSAGEPVDGIRARACKKGDAWLWDGVRFVVLSPPEPGYGNLSSNNASCVIEIDDGAHRVLLTGDIEAMAERNTAAQRATVVLVPHHGSRTSSSSSFVRRTCPLFAIISAGYRNRFGHPHPEVIERYRSIGAHVVTTGRLGAIGWSSKDPASITAARSDWRYWRSRPWLSMGLVPMRNAASKQTKRNCDAD